MIETLFPLLVGNLGYLRDRLVSSDDTRPAIPVERLLQPETIDPLVGHFARRYPSADRRAVVSAWSQWYFGAVVVPATAAALLLNRVPPLCSGGAAVVIGTEGYPIALRLPNGGSSLPAASTFDRFAPLVRRHLDPLIVGMAGRFGVAPRLLWSNAASTAEWTLREVEALPDAPPDVGAHGDRLFGSRTWPDGWPNPLFAPTRRVEAAGAPARRRRVCCLRYRLPGVADCGSSCPFAGRHVR